MIGCHCLDLSFILNEAVGIPEFFLAHLRAVCIPSMDLGLFSGKRIPGRFFYHEKNANTLALHG